MTGGHDHEGFGAPPEFADPLGRPVNRDLLGRFIGAAFDGCKPCQEALAAEISEDAVTAARLVELACLAVDSTVGGVPSAMTSDDAPGLASPEFRKLARAGADGHNAAMFDECAAMTAAERRSAVETAADLLIGQMMIGSPEPPS